MTNDNGNINDGEKNPIRPSILNAGKERPHYQAENMGKPTEKVGDTTQAESEKAKIKQTR
ncbi:MAG: hypothetical protein R3D71_07325 [Rickettsiales bacterium]